jgi:hypothetical protein
MTSKRIINKQMNEARNSIPDFDEKVSNMDEKFNKDVDILGEKT